MPVTPKTQNEVKISQKGNILVEKGYFVFNTCNGFTKNVDIIDESEDDYNIYLVVLYLFSDLIILSKYYYYNNNLFLIL